MLISWRTIIVLTFLVVLLVGCIILQVFLSRRESPWPGLVLPGISFLYSLIVMLNAAILFDSSGWEIVSTFLIVFLLYNIPTLVLLVIYFACRGKYRRRREIDKMNAQDLE